MKPILLCLLLAAPALSSSELVGTWETRSVDEFGAGEAVFRMTLSADGSLQMELVLILPADPWSLVLGDLGEGVVGAEPELPPFETIDVRGSGTWEATADSFRIGPVGETVLTVNGNQDPTEFSIGAGRILARAIADAQGVSEADYPDFEAAFVAEFASEFIAGFIDLEEGMFGTETDREAYAVEGDRLRLTDVDGETTEFQRVENGTAVTPASWGRVKRQMR